MITPLAALRSRSSVKAADVIVYRDGDYAVAVDRFGNEIARSTDHASVIQEALRHGGRIVLNGDFKLSSSIVVRDTIDMLSIIHTHGRIFWEGVGHAIQLNVVNYLYVNGLHVVGTDGQVSPQGVLKASSGIAVVVEDSSFEKMLPDINTSTFQLLWLDNYKIIIVEKNLISASQNIGNVNGFDNLTLSPDTEDSMVVVRGNRVENFGDAIVMWGGLCIAEGNMIVNSPFGSPWGVDFARCKFGIARSNLVKSTTIARGIYAHAASSNITPKQFIIESNRIEADSSTNNIGSIDVTVGDEIIISKNIIINPVRGVYVHAYDSSMKHVVVKDNVIYSPTFIGIAVYAEKYDIESSHVEGNKIVNPSGNSVFYLRSYNGILHYAEARGNLVMNPGSLSVGIWNINVIKKKIFDNEPGINTDGVVEVLSDCGSLSSTGDYTGQLVACYDSANSKWVLKVWDGSAWQTIG